jgi:hypothetical protein
MSSYHRVPLDDDDRDETIPMDRRSKYIAKSSKSSIIFSPLLIFLIALNVSLAGANLWMSHSITEVLELVPVQNVMSLERPDQYIGLSDESRQKCASQYVGMTFSYFELMVCG